MVWLPLNALLEEDERKMVDWSMAVQLAKDD